MQRRIFQRIQVDFKVRYFCGDNAYNGTVTDLSENGMFIDTTIDFPFDSNFKLVLPLNDEVINVSAIIKRVVKSKGIYNGIGVELENPPENYLQFVNKLRLT
ncbi:PilZ domain protein [bacterium BMS3Abin09]|nr:PilZ domain protein [bacterium BMS3Abin09]